MWLEPLLLVKCGGRALITSSHRLSSSSLPVTTPKSGLISQARALLNHYMLGSKLLYSNYKDIRQLQQKDTQSLTRQEKLAIDQFRYDIRVGIPFVAVFMVPVLGYAAPLIAVLAPKYLPSTLITPQQKVKLLLGDAMASRSIIDSLVEHTKNQYNSDVLEAVVPTMQFINDVSSSKDPSRVILASISSLSSLFNRCFPLSSFSREHVLLLHRSILHSSFVARHLLSNYSLEAQLDKWQYQIWLDDQQLTHINDLSPAELVSTLYARGLYLYPDKMGQVLRHEQIRLLGRMEKKKKVSNQSEKIEDDVLNDWRHLLSQWINIHKKVSQYNPVATNFLLHVPPLLSQQ